VQDNDRYHTFFHHFGELVCNRSVCSSKYKISVQICYSIATVFQLMSHTVCTPLPVKLLLVADSTCTVPYLTVFLYLKSHYMFGVFRNGVKHTCIRRKHISLFLADMIKGKLSSNCATISNTML
jgi:hypothetical protein